MNKRNIYWTCQIAGWTAYTSLDQFIFGLKFGYGDNLIVNALVNIIMGVTITHSYRIIIKRLSWLDLPLARLIPRITISVALMAVIMASINIPLDHYTIPATRKLFSLYPIVIVVLYIINWFKHLLLWSLIYHLFQYFERSKKNEVEKIRLTSSVRDFEAKILRSQLNPHFMFNALNSIRALVLENPEKAQISVTRLSNLLRNSLLADRRKTVTLQEELKTVQDYLALEKNQV